MEKKVSNGTTSTELDSFLPKDGSNTNGTTITKYKITTKGNDLEAAVTPDFDPFKARSLEHPVSDGATLAHLLKAFVGTGILSMPAAFQASGLVLGIFATIMVSVICTHCSYILVVCAHELYKRTGKTSMSFADVAEICCLKGPEWARRFGPAARQIVLIGIFITYFATCSCYTVIIASNFNYVINNYLGADNKLDARIIIAALLVPLLLLSYVPNLKYLAPVSMVANAFMATGLGITFYYLVVDLPPLGTARFVSSLGEFPAFIGITVFALEAIGVVMPLENNMKTPQHFVGICGVLNKGLTGITLVYILVGFFGYLHFGDKVKGSITLNLDAADPAAQAVQILIGLAVFCTYGLQFYVCLEIVWDGVKKYFTKRETLANYVVRTILVIATVLLAIAVPAIKPFVALVGAFCFSLLGLIFPVFMEIITFWDKGFGKFYWKIGKIVVVVILGLAALFFGSKSAIEEIIEFYQQVPEVPHSLNVTTNH